MLEVQSDVLPCTNGEELRVVHGVEADVRLRSVSPASDARIGRVLAVRQGEDVGFGGGLSPSQADLVATASGSGRGRGGKYNIGPSPHCKLMLL